MMAAMPAVGRHADDAGGAVLDFAQARIRRALAQRSRYRYVQPRLEAEGQGWKIVSPNCSRNIDKQGGDIDIAWLTPDGEGGWLLFARDHARRSWNLRARSRRLAELLTRLVVDRDREFWQ
ncbi:hypothetical protein GALL_509800 [mine drainage metagenome]|uniref:DUF3024 domain-containing protein n=1 Tax=mine drainage metagenome TaxID=410659 RepID=A0A1J5PQ79_9ZZZZ